MKCFIGSLAAETDLQQMNYCKFTDWLRIIVNILTDWLP